MDLRAALRQDRLGVYVRLRGGFTFPLAGAIWWGAAAVLGAFVPVKTWALLAFIGSGLIRDAASSADQRTPLTTKAVESRRSYQYA